LIERYAYGELVQWFASVGKDAREFSMITYMCFTKLHEWFHLRFINPPEIISEDDSNEIVNHLADLFVYYQQFSTQSNLYKEIQEKLGMLLEQACHTVYRKIVMSYLDSCANPDYEYIKRLAPSHALEGFAHYLCISGNTSDLNARLLGIKHAQVKMEASNNLAKENERLKKELQEFKQERDKSQQESSLPKRKEVNPGFFDPLSTSPVKSQRTEQLSDKDKRSAVIARRR
jgi:hypothetical protein